MSTLAATLIVWDAVWKIVAAALIGGAGVVVAFGLAVLSLERARTARSGAIRLAHRTAAGVCGGLCAAAIAIGLYAMTDKPSSSATPKPAGHGLTAAPRPGN